MKVSGFSFVKNAVIYDYPFVEAIRSILPICDEFVVAVGKSEDNTLELVQNIDPQKIKIVETTWDDKLREEGRVLAVETDKAFSNISEDADWAFYIQGDEVVHEKYLDTIYKAMLRCKDEQEIDGLLFKYLHFYGSYDHVGASSHWFENEIRVIKNDPSIYSHKDAQGFRKGDNKKLRVHPIDAYIYHYGWVKDPKTMQQKQKDFHKLWHQDDWIKENVENTNEFDYNTRADDLIPFLGEHPEVMKERIRSKNWDFNPELLPYKTTLKDRSKNFLRNRLGLRVGYENYTIQKLKGRE